MRKIILSIFVVLGSLCFALENLEIPAIREEHPRLDLEPSRWEWLRENISAGKGSSEGAGAAAQESAETFSKLQWYYYNEWLNSPEFYMEGENSKEWNFEWGRDGDLEMARLTAFLLQINHDELSGKRCEFIASKYSPYLDSIQFDSFSDHDSRENMFRNNCNYGSLFFDWAYNSMSSRTRRRLARSLYRLLETFLLDYIIDVPGGESYVSSHNNYNCIITMRICLALYNAEGLSEKKRNQIEEWYKILLDKWETGILPAQAYFRGKEGGWNWGSAYGIWGLRRQYQFFDDMLAATGKNYYRQQSWIKNSINQYWYYFRPSHYTIHFGDSLIPYEYPDRVMYRHAAVFQDDRSRYLVQKYAKLDNLNNPTDVLDKLLQYDFSAVEKPPAPHPALPLNWYAPRVGMSISRSSWERDAAMVWFSCPTARRADHEHRDNNTFVIIKDMPLILHSGAYSVFAAPHYGNYYTRTIAHNSICVFDRNEEFAIFGRRVSNDGGQLESERLENLSWAFRPEHQRGEWLKYAATDAYVYNAADAGKSYSPEKLDRFERRLLYLKPDKVIVLDYLHINNIKTAERRVKYINHFVNRPEISGRIIHTEVPGHIITYSGPDCIIQNGRGTAALRTLLPLKSTTTLIGGEGYEFWVNGKNYPPDEFEDGDYHPGSWRIEVEPETVEEDLIFLHTIKIGDDINPARPGGEVIQTEDTIAADWDNTLYLFSSSGKMDNAQYTVRPVWGGRTLKVMALDVKPDSSYGLYVNNQLRQKAVSTGRGIVEFGAEFLKEDTQNAIEVRVRSLKSSP